MKRAILFTLALTTLTVYLLFALIHIGWISPNRGAFIRPIVFAFTMWIPGVVALILAKKERIELPHFSKQYGWLGLSFLIPIGIMSLTILIARLFTPLTITDTLILAIRNSGSTLSMGIIKTISIAFLLTLGAAFSINAFSHMGKS